MFKLPIDKILALWYYYVKENNNMLKEYEVYLETLKIDKSKETYRSYKHILENFFNSMKIESIEDIKNMKSEDTQKVIKLNMKMITKIVEFEKEYSYAPMIQLYVKRITDDLSIEFPLFQLNNWEITPLGFNFTHQKYNENDFEFFYQVYEYERSEAQLFEIK